MSLPTAARLSTRCCRSIVQKPAGRTFPRWLDAKKEVALFPCLRRDKSGRRWWRSGIFFSFWVRASCGVRNIPAADRRDRPSCCRICSKPLCSKQIPATIGKRRQEGGKPFRKHGLCVVQYRVTYYVPDEMIHIA